MTTRPIDKDWFALRCRIIGLSQNEVARRIGLQPSSLSAILNGRRELKASEAVQISHILRAPLPDLISRLTGLYVDELLEHSVPMPYSLGQDAALERIEGEHIASARAFLPEGAICIQCRTLRSSDATLKSMDRWRLFCAPFSPATLYVGRFVVARLAQSNRIALGMLMPGYEPGQYQVLGPLPATGLVTDAAAVLYIATP